MLPTVEMARFVEEVVNRPGVLPPRAKLRKERRDSGPPLVGTWRHGDVTWNDTPARGQPVGWVCVTDGTPGDWGEFGVVT